MGRSGNTYYIKEISAPAGYDINKTIFEIFLSGHGVSVTIAGDEETGNLPFLVWNKKTPPEEPEEPEEPDTPDEKIEVKGLTGEITVLAFTGIAMGIPITGASIVMSGIGMLFWLLINRRKNWKHVWRKKK